jgi:hypothetical protein
VPRPGVPRCWSPQSPFHLKKGFFLAKGGYEYTLMLGAAALTVAFCGPRSLSADAVLDP